MRSVRISAKHARALLSIAEDVLPVHPAVVELRRAVQLKAAVRERRKVRESRLDEQNAETAQLRGILELRAKGRCEECNYAFSASNPAELDHFFGRGRVLQSVSNCWLLCRACHRSKTDNKPSAARWLERFIRHCDRFGFKAEAWAATARLESLRLVPRGVR